MIGGQCEFLLIIRYVFTEKGELLMEERNHNDKNTPLRSIGHLARPIEGWRLPAPDVMGYLADSQIRQPDFEIIGEHVRDYWPNVTSIEAGVLADKLYMAISITPFSKEAQEAHWPLADWIKLALDTKNLSFFFLPPSETKACSSEITVYRSTHRKDNPYEDQAA